jgi:hypothetical protein
VLPTGTCLKKENNQFSRCFPKILLVDRGIANLEFVGQEPEFRITRAIQLPNPGF